jgi:hypothetical protein
MQPLNRVLLLLLMIGAGLYYWRQEQTKSEYQRQVGALSSALDRRYLSPANPAAQSEAMFLRALVILADFRSLVARDRLPAGEDAYLRDALIAAGYVAPGEIALVSRTLKSNLNLCQELKIIGSDEGVQALLTGQAPIIRTGSFKGDTLVIGRQIPPSLAPELANHPANYALLPSAAATLIWPFTFTDAVMTAITEFSNQGLLDLKTTRELQKRAEQVKAAQQP